MNAHMTTSDPVVVGFDGSESALHAVRWAAREASLVGASLSIVYACGLDTVRVPAGLPAPRPYHQAVMDIGAQYLSEAAAAANAVAPTVEITMRLAQGAAAPTLVGLSSAAHAIVVGSRGLGGFTGLLVGSTAVAVAAHGHCPLVVVRGEHQDATLGPVVVGANDSSENDAVLAFASRAAALRGVAPVVVPNATAHTLLHAAANAQLVVVGSRGRGGVSGLLLGSTSQALIQHAPCPVAVIPMHP